MESLMTGTECAMLVAKQVGNVMESARQLEWMFAILLVLCMGLIFKIYFMNKKMKKLLQGSQRE